MPATSVTEKAAAPAASGARGRSLRGLISSTLSVDGDTTIADVSRLFEAHPEADSIAVIDGARTGIVVRARFYLPTLQPVA